MKFIHLRIVRVNVKMTSIVNFGFGMDQTPTGTKTRVGSKQAMQNSQYETEKYLDQNVVQVNSEKITKFFI